MEEQDYIELQTLLAKLRVSCLKEIGNPEIESSERERNFKMIRYIDHVRNGMPLKLKEGTIYTVK